MNKHSKDWISIKINDLSTAARESLPYNSTQQSLVQLLRSYVDLLLTHMDTLTDLRAQITKQSKLSPSFNLLTPIPGVGNLTAATIICEIGDISRFSIVKKLIAFVGLDPSVCESESLSHLIIEFPNVVLLIFEKLYIKLHLLALENPKVL